MSNRFSCGLLLDTDLFGCETGSILNRSGKQRGCFSRMVRMPVGVSAPAEVHPFSLYSQCLVQLVAIHLCNKDRYTNNNNKRQNKGMVLSVLTKQLRKEGKVYRMKNSGEDVRR